MPKYPDARIPTENEVRDIVADKQHKYTRIDSDDLYPVDKWTIVEGILGTDPSSGNYRGGLDAKTRESYVNPHLSMSALVKLLDRMVDEGVLTKVNKPTYRTRSDPWMQKVGRAVRFWGATAGWVLTESFDASLAKADARKRDQDRRKLRKAAEKQIIEKYAKQVDTAYRKLCADAGLDPEIEQPDPDPNKDQEF